MISAVWDPFGVCLRREATVQVGRRQVDAAVRDGVVVAPWVGVLVDARRAGEPRTLAAAALRLAGPAAALSGPSAAHLLGCAAVPMTPVDLVVPYEHPLRSRPGLLVHNSRRIEPDRVLVDGLPALNLERAVTDILCTGRPEDALAVADQALALVGPDEEEALRDGVRRRLRERADPRGTRRAAQLIDIASAAAESPAESWLRWHLVDAGFPVPAVNWWVCDVDGVGLYRVDLAWPELRILVEYDGYAAHAEREAADARRRDDLRRRGWIVVVAEADDLRSAYRLTAELQAAFRRRGVDLRVRLAERSGPRRRRTAS